jgi:hypothetical protein
MCPPETRCYLSRALESRSLLEGGPALKQGPHEGGGGWGREVER